MARFTLLSKVDISRLREAVDTVGLAIADKVAASLPKNFQKALKDLVELRDVMAQPMPEVTDKHVETIRRASVRLRTPVAQKEMAGLPPEIKKAISTLSGLAFGLRVAVRQPGEDRPDGFKPKR